MDKEEIQIVEVGDFPNKISSEPDCYSTKSTIVERYNMASPGIRNQPANMLKALEVKKVDKRNNGRKL